jgi:hypothetical protein
LQIVFAATVKPAGLEWQKRKSKPLSILPMKLARNSPAFLFQCMSPHVARLYGPALRCKSDLMIRRRLILRFCIRRRRQHARIHRLVHALVLVAKSLTPYQSPQYRAIAVCHTYMRPSPINLDRLAAKQIEVLRHWEGLSCPR